MKILLLMALTTLLLSSFPVEASTIYVDAYVDLQDGLGATISDDEIWVAADTYTPSSSLNPSSTFLLKNGVALYGGFVGDETLSYTVYFRSTWQRSSHPGKRPCGSCVSQR